MQIVGIDPGKKGCVCALSTTSINSTYYQFEFDKNNTIRAIPLVQYLNTSKADLVIFEKSHGHGPGGSTQKFTQGSTYGQALGIVIAAGLPIQLVSPQSWQKILHDGIKAGLAPKDRSLIAYRNLFPHEPIEQGRSKRPHDGIVDSLLIACYGVLKYGGGAIKKWKVKKWVG